jgi:hypothetical protein
MTRLAGVSSFTWSTSEQVWPFEKAADGSTLYCKEIDCGYLGNSGWKSTAHNLGAFELVHSILGVGNFYYAGHLGRAGALTIPNGSTGYLSIYKWMQHMYKYMLLLTILLLMPK